MSVSSVLSGRATPCPPVSGNNPQSGKFAVLAKPSQGNPATQAVEAGYADSADASQFQSTLAQALREDGATTAGSTSGPSESDRSPSSAGIALYKRISQIGNSEPSPSELLESWNSIMQSGRGAGDAGAATLQALLRSGAPAFGSAILDVTA
jgi:hypothetical protein